MGTAWKRGLWPDPGLLVELPKFASEHVVFGDWLQEDAAACGGRRLPATDISAGWGLGLKRTGPVSVLWKNRQGEETCGEVGAGIY